MPVKAVKTRFEQFDGAWVWNVVKTGNLVEPHAPRTGNRHTGMSLCPYNVYPTSDGYIAIITNNTGKAVHAVALSKDNHNTSGATASKDNGRTKTNCPMHNKHATEVAQPGSRMESMRWTNWPL